MGRKGRRCSGEAAVGVGGRVGEAEVGFDLDDAPGESLAVEVADEELAEEGSRDDLGGARVEASWEEFEQARWLCPGKQSFCVRKCWHWQFFSRRAWIGDSFCWWARFEFPRKLDSEQ